jgi:hypothetical protein
VLAREMMNEKAAWGLGGGGRKKGEMAAGTGRYGLGLRYGLASQVE